MTEENKHDLILNAIDTISFRKNRPNIARIYRHLVRFSNITSATCEKLLDELVEQGRVIKVTYKGNISYRNAAKWKQIHRYNKKNDTKKTNMTAKKCSSLLSGTIAELIVRVQSYFRTGVPCKVLEDELLNKDKRFTKESIHKLIQKELQQETLIQLDNGNYFVAVKNSIASEEDSDSNNGQDNKDDEKNKDPNVNTLIEEIQDDDDEEALGEEEEEEEDFMEETDDDDEDYELDEDEIEAADADDGSDDKSERTRQAVTNESETIELCGDSEEEFPLNDSFRKKDEDYLPPKSVNISTRRSSSGRLSVRNKNTRYDPSEYFFPSLKRTYKARQEKSVINKQQKKHNKVLTSAEFKKTLLNPLPSGSTQFHPSKTATLVKTRIPVIPMKSEFLKDNYKNYVCTICNDSKAPVTKTNSVRCKICRKAAHSSCVNNDPMAAKFKPESTSWTCDTCRKKIYQPCSICHQVVSKNGSLVVCVGCKLSYHSNCHKPIIGHEDAVSGTWRCCGCSIKIRIGDNKVEYRVPPGLSITPRLSIVSPPKFDEENNATEGRFEEVLIDELKEKIIITTKRPFSYSKEKQVEFIEINDSAVKRPQQLPEPTSLNSTPTSSPTSSQVTTEDILTKEEDSDNAETPAKLLKDEDQSVIPDSSDWSANEVYKYFKDLFDENIAEAFLKQEIDGNSLKFLRRSDVLRGLGFKLGIGLNVLYHVKMLQLRTNNLKLIWAAE